ncbi:MAG: histidine kinase [Cyclobacteriaceae bacterium]
MPFTLHELQLILVSVFGTSVVFNLALFFGYHKKPDYLFFAFYCAFHVFKIWLKTFPSAQVLIPFLDLMAIDLIYLSVVLGLLSLNVFLSYHYELSNKNAITTAGIIFSILAFFTMPEDLFIYIGIAAAIAQSVLKIRLSKEGWSYLSGLILLLVLTILGTNGTLPYGYFIGTIFMILIMVISSGVTLAQQTQRLNEASLKSSQLENQLLKKSIQPHFILNSLTSLQELIEQRPRKASSFVYELSRVFSMFARVSDQQLIDLSRELELVESFLKVMSVRMDKHFELITKDIDGEEKIPPGILLTLVENGVTHGFEERPDGEFIINKETTSGRSTILTVENNGSPPAGIKEGVGLQYVRSRLEEAFGNDFSLTFKNLPNGFLTTITIGL